MFFCTCIIFQDQCHKAGKGSMCPPPLIQKKKKRKKESPIFNPWFILAFLLCFFSQDRNRNVPEKL